jgi:hypothetical protein
MDIIKKGFHVGLLIVNLFFIFFYYVLFNKGHVVHDENNDYFGMRFCYKDTNYVIGCFPIIPNYITFHDYEGRIDALLTP